VSGFLDVEIAEILVSLDDEPVPTVVEVAAETTVVQLTVMPDVLLPDVVEINTGTPGMRGSLWYWGDGPPATTPGAVEQDVYLDVATGDIWVVADEDGVVSGPYGYGPYGTGPYGGG
jgi:hypothetical protein